MAEKPKTRGRPFTKNDPRRNNGGIPEVVRKLRELLQHDANAAAKYLKECVAGKQKDVALTMGGAVLKVPMKAKERIKAAEIVLEFSIAKPKQELEISGADGEPLVPPQRFDLSGLSLEELVTVKALLAKAKPKA